MARRLPRLSLDVGRVITRVDPAELREGEGALSKPHRRNSNIWVPGALSAVSDLVALFQGEVWLISKCGEEIAQWVRKRLEVHRFFKQTGLDPEHLMFCRTHEEKARVAERKGIDIHMDDSPTVIDAMRDRVAVRILFNPDEDRLRRFPLLQQEVVRQEVTVVWSWREARLQISEERQELLRKRRLKRRSRR